MIAPLRRARYGPASWSRVDGSAGPNHAFWLQGRAPGRQADAGERGVSQRGVALRPDERPDVGGPAPGLEGHHDQRAQSAEERYAVRAARRRRRHRRHRVPRRQGGGFRLPRHRLRHQHRHARGRPRARRGATSRRPGLLRRRQCRSAALSRPQLRRLYDRVRHSQRAADRPRAARGLSRAEARQPLPVPGILHRRRARARPDLRSVLVQGDPAARPRGHGRRRILSISRRIRSANFRSPTPLPR